MLEIKLNIVNKREYEENHNYREVIIKLPKSEEELKKDFEYLDLDYKNLSIQDSHVLDCVVIDPSDPHFSGIISTELSDIIDRAKDSGWTTPYQDIKSMYAILTFLNGNERDKLLAVLEFKKEQISNMKDAVKYGNNLKCFEFYSDINSAKDYARKLINTGELTARDILDYIDLERLGEQYNESEKGVFTNHGLIFEKEYIDKVIKNQREDEEEFE